MIVTREDLRRMRMEAGYSQSDLADVVGVSQAYIARMERGDLDPKLSIVHAIVETLTGLRKLLCSEIMTENPVTVDSRQTIHDAIERMKEGHFSQLPVVRGNRVIGCVTDEDVFMARGLDKRRVSVEAIMNPLGIPTVEEETPISVILPLFQTFQAVVVQNQGRISGIISRTDLLKLGKQGIRVRVSV